MNAQGTPCGGGMGLIDDSDESADDESDPVISDRSLFPGHPSGRWSCAARSLCVLSTFVVVCSDSPSSARTISSTFVSCAEECVTALLTSGLLLSDSSGTSVCIAIPWLSSARIKAAQLPQPRRVVRCVKIPSRQRPEHAKMAKTAPPDKDQNRRDRAF